MLSPEFIHIALTVVGVAAGWYASRANPAATTLDTALELLAARYPAIRPVVKVIEEAEHNGALDKLKDALAASSSSPQAPPAK